MDIPMLVSEIREQLQGLQVDARIELRTPGRAGRRGKAGSVSAAEAEEISDIRLTALALTSLPLALPIAVPEPALLPGFMDRVGQALAASLRECPVWLARLAVADVRAGRKLYRADREVRCELGIAGASFAWCGRHGWEVRAVRFTCLVLPDLDTEFHMVELVQGP